MLNLLTELVDTTKEATYVELRYHALRHLLLRASRGELISQESDSSRGVCVKVIAGGGWGSSSIRRVDKQTLSIAIRKTARMARASARGRKRVRLAPARMARGSYACKTGNPSRQLSMDEKLAQVRENSCSVGVLKRVVCSYEETREHKYIVNSDGAAAEVTKEVPEYSIEGVVKGVTGQVEVSLNRIIAGAPEDLLKNFPIATSRLELAASARRLSNARAVRKGNYTVVLDPALAGAIAHEAVGHLAEADRVAKGSILAARLGRKIASQNVSIVDCGSWEQAPLAAGWTPVDDEGVLAGTCWLVKDGILCSYLHNRESAFIEAVEPTGNSRTARFDGPSLIRMRNTYVLPRDYSLEEMIEGVNEGFLLVGAQTGHADIKGSFAFKSCEAYRITRGELGRTYLGPEIRGRSLKTLKSVDAVGKEFVHGYGGYCVKSRQYVPIDDGGPYLRCKSGLRLN